MCTEYRILLLIRQQWYHTVLMASHSNSDIKTFLSSSILYSFINCHSLKIITHND